MAYPLNNPSFDTVSIGWLLPQGGKGSGSDVLCGRKEEPED